MVNASASAVRTAGLIVCHRNCRRYDDASELQPQDSYQATRHAFAAESRSGHDCRALNSIPAKDEEVAGNRSVGAQAWRLDQSARAIRAVTLRHSGKEHVVTSGCSMTGRCLQ
jgi:hypothetical protein